MYQIKITKTEKYKQETPNSAGRIEFEREVTILELRTESLANAVKVIEQLEVPAEKKDA